MSAAGFDLPLWAAPMAGGVSTAGLGAAVTQAGAFASLAGGYKTPEVLGAEIEAARAWNRPFAVNLFVPGRTLAEPARAERAAAVASYAERIDPDAREVGAELDLAPHDMSDHWAEKLDLLCERPVPVVSFTFGLPGADAMRRLVRAGSQLVVTVTSPTEALAAAAAGAHGLIVQGSAAGGHSAAWDCAHRVRCRPTTDLVAAVRAVTSLPIAAAGGVSAAADVQTLLTAGATSTVVGTALLRADEAGTSATHRAGLASPEFTRTELTRAFTGRWARALVNGFASRHGAYAPDAYPELHFLTSPMRRAAAAAGDVERLHLWAGTGWRAARAAPAAVIIEELAGGL